MKDLIERLEKAEGPDRKLDAEIAAAVGAERGPREIVHVESRSYSVYDEVARRYTTSIDAALTLVPEELAIHEMGHYSRDKKGWYVTILTRGPDCSSGHLVPAIAVCIAALKARQHFPAESEQVDK